MKTIVFQIGSEWAPDSPYGLDILEFDAGGRFRYENRTRGDSRTATGWIEASALGEIDRVLRDASFPKVPEHMIPPGASLIELRVRDGSGDTGVYMDYHAALRFPGYGEVIRRLEGWASWLRKGPSAEPAPPGISRDLEGLA